LHESSAWHDGGPAPSSFRNALGAAIHFEKNRFRNFPAVIGITFSGRGAKVTCKTGHFSGNVGTIGYLRRTQEKNRQLRPSRWPLALPALLETAFPARSR
jgi:hypothetical protein